MRRRLIMFAALCASVVLAGAGAASASAGPVWNLDLQHNETNFPPGGAAEYWVDLANVGDAPSAGPVTLTINLPVGLSRNSVRTSFDYVYFPGVGWSCPGSVGDTTIVCTTTEAIGRHTINRELIVLVNVDPPPDGENDLVTSASVQGGGAPEVSAVEPTHISSEPAGFGVLRQSFVPDFFKADELSVEREAGARPDLLTISADANSVAFPVPGNPYQKLASETVRDLEVSLPPGFIANANAANECTAADFTFGHCLPSSQVGRVDLRTYPITGSFSDQGYGALTTGIFNLAHPRGGIGDLAFAIGGNAVHIKVSLDPGNHYAIRVRMSDLAEFKPAFRLKMTLWGVPADPSHDSERCTSFSVGFIAGIGGSTADECSTDAASLPLLGLPSQCESDNVFRLLHYRSWQRPDLFGPEIDYTMPGRITDCDRPRFDPDVEAVPTGKQANTPTGLDVHVKIAQNENPNALATPPMKRFTITSPQGTSFSPSFADGLQSCTLAQMNFGTNDPVRCPDAARIGEVRLRTPLLPRVVEGSMYLAAPVDNPFESLFALYLVLQDTEERGVLVKMPGRIDVDPVSGLITATFRDTPQFPFEDLTLKFRSGPRAPLISPPSCGRQTIGIEVASYAQPRDPVDASNTYQVTEGPNGTPCPPDSAHRSFSPRFSAGTLNPVAGSYSTFLARLSREDQEQELSQITTLLPPGLVAKIAGLPFCPDQAIASISTAVGAGAVEMAHPACPAASQIGSVSVGLGAGPGPNYFPGKLYLAGPYKGAPLSLAVVAPALAGPFDLGNVVVKTALYVDPESAQVRAVTDPFPTILHGVILRARDIRLRLDRPQTTINPTNCSPMSVKGLITGVGGDLQSTADDSLFGASAPFQVGSCASLGFEPRLSLHLFGGTRRGSHPKLKATLRMPKDGANIASASVALPQSEFLDQEHIGTVCTRPQFAADKCPAASVYGEATAKTPLLDEPLFGKVYLRSSKGLLPDIVLALRGKVAINVVGHIDSAGGGIRTSFGPVPDAPLESVTLTLAGGRKGLLVNSDDICTISPRATAKFAAQNGDRVTLHPKLKSACEKRSHAGR